MAEAFMHDPNVRAKCADASAVSALVDDMIDATKPYLPSGWFC